MSDEYIATLVEAEIEHSRAVIDTQAAPVEPDPMVKYLPIIAAVFVMLGIVPAALGIVITIGI